MIRFARAAVAAVLFLSTGVLCAVTVSCSKTDYSPVSVISDSGSIPLVALNQGSLDAKMDSDTPYAYFAFPAGASFPKNTALQLSVTAKGKTASRFAFGFLFESDFSSPRRLKKQLDDRPLVRGEIHTTKVSVVSFAVPEGALGFFTHSTSELEILECRALPAVYGWKRGANSEWAGFSSAGGVLSEQHATAFTAAHVSDFADTGSNIRVVFERISALPERRLPRITLSVGKTALTIERAPHQYEAVFNTALFDNQDDFAVTILSGSDSVWSVTLENAAQVSSREPIPADPGLVLNWNRSAWRTPDFEVFSWQQVPSVLLFDTADYRVQDDFFKRLAFFVEKSGYRGRLVSDREIADVHGFNAHDYRAESLADFFETARKTDFPLNEKEQLLRGLLLDAGIITASADGRISAGEGAIVSISRESGAYLRRLFMAHEGLHALYFIDSGFREQVALVYGAMEPQSLEFLHQYFAVTPSLNYDLKDTYLIKNEFMAYVLQQPVSAAADYFGNTLANRNYINRSAPELAAHVRRTKGVAFSAAAAELDKYIYGRWGYNAGKVWLVIPD